MKKSCKVSAGKNLEKNLIEKLNERKSLLVLNSQNYQMKSLK